MRSMLRAFSAAALLLCAGLAAAQETGKLTVDIAAFNSEIELKPKIKAQLESGGLEWGAKDGLVVFTMVNKRFINFDIPNFTRYGTQQTVELPAGDYKITGIGLIPSTAFSPEKILNKGAYFNEGIMAFRIEPGQTVTLKVNPVIRKNATFFINYFMPEILVAVEQNGQTGAETSVVAKTDASTPWAGYTGPLKFAPAK